MNLPKVTDIGWCSVEDNGECFYVTEDECMGLIKQGGWTEHELSTFPTPTFFETLNKSLTPQGLKIVWFEGINVDQGGFTKLFSIPVYEG